MHARRALALCLAATLALGACGDDPDEEQTADIQGVEVESGQSRDHIETGFSYDAAPPSGGDHHPVWLNCDIYETPVPDEHAVHALEHGVVWFAHQPDLPDDEVESLATLFASQPGRVIVSPYPDLPAPVVAVAWERRLEADSAHDPRLAQFLDTYVNGDAAPEPSASCEGGVGQG